MSGTFVRYRDIAPATTDLRELRANLDRVRAEHPALGLEALQHLCREAGRQGAPLDGLRRHTADETERFFAFTLQGPDGHVYWDGPKRFIRNDDTSRSPLRWWWEHLHGPLGPGVDVLTGCGDAMCVNAAHATAGRSERRILWPEHKILGALQVVALQLGHSPSSADWERGKNHPTREIVAKRFGSWENAIRAAGLPEVVAHVPPHKQFTPIAKVHEALRVAAAVLGRRPTFVEFETHPAVRAALTAERLPVNPETITKRIGKRWQAALDEVLGPR